MVDGTGGSATNSIIIAPRTGGATDASGTTGNAFPLTVIARMARKLDQQNVDTNNRWLVIDPVFIELLKDEDSRLFQADFGGSGGLQNGLVLTTYMVLKSICLTIYLKRHRSFYNRWSECFITMV